MTLGEFRSQYPDYDDISDEEVLSWGVIEEGEEPDLVVPALYDIEEAINKLNSSIIGIDIPDNTAPVIDLLKQIKNKLVSLESAIKGIDINVNVPHQKIPVVNIPEMVFPEIPKGWEFTIIYDKRGNITGAEATAK